MDIFGEKSQKKWSFCSCGVSLVPHTDVKYLKFGRVECHWSHTHQSFDVVWHGSHIKICHNHSHWSVVWVSFRYLLCHTILYKWKPPSLYRVSGKAHASESTLHSPKIKGWVDDIHSECTKSSDSRGGSRGGHTFSDQSKYLIQTKTHFFCGCDWVIEIF